MKKIDLEEEMRVINRRGDKYDVIFYYKEDKLVTLLEEINIHTILNLHGYTEDLKYKGNSDYDIVKIQQEQYECCGLETIWERGEDIITWQEYDFLRTFDSERVWIARDENGALNLFIETAPHKDKQGAYWISDGGYTFLDEYRFPFISFEEEEPRSIESLIHLRTEKEAYPYDSRLKRKVFSYK